MSAVIAGLANTGCIVAEGCGHGHYRERSAVIVGPTAIVVPVPVVVVRPPGIYVH